MLNFMKGNIKMLNMSQSGKKIARLRKEQNMTQMELAEKMNVSFQAVSNWERGNTLPDIANLPRLARLLNTTTDELLGVSEELAENAANDNLKNFVTENPVSKEEAVTAAPLLTPEENDELFRSTHPMDEADWADALPFLSNEFIDSLFEEAAKNENDELLEELAPYASDEVINAYVLQQTEKGKVPENILVFASDDVLLKAAKGLTEGKTLSAAEKFFPYLSGEGIFSLAKTEYEKNGMKNLEDVLPYLKNEDLLLFFQKIREENGFREAKAFYPYLRQKDLFSLTLSEYEKNGVKNLEDALPFLRKEELSSLARRVFEKDGFSAIRRFLPYLPEKFPESFFDRK